jgi:hypothetical protein
VQDVNVVVVRGKFVGAFTSSVWAAVIRDENVGVGCHRTDPFDDPRK